MNRVTILIALSWMIVLVSCRKDQQQEKPDPHVISMHFDGSWKLCSTPLMFHESRLVNDLSYGMNRAKISWYKIDASVFHLRGSTLRPMNITSEDMSKDNCRAIWESELFPEMENPAGHPMSFPTMNLDFYPNERGPYNFETGPSAYSAGLTVDGGLLDPDSRWGGIMCALPELDYQYHYLDLWLMDPSQDYPGVTGKLYIDIGQITEDILQDGQWAAEHFTKDDPDTTAWGFVRPLYSYSNFSAGFSYDQDVGLDELSSDEECSFYFKYLDYVQQHCNESFYSATREDVSGDDFHYYLGKDYDELNYKVRERYKNWTGMEANSTRASVSYYISTRSPDSEDLNHNGKLDTINFYSEYEISIDPSNFVAGQNYFLEEHTFNGSNSDLRLENGKTYNSKFYHFIIPLDTAVPVNGIPFSAVRPEFMRIFLTGFNQEINLRIIDLRLSEKLPD